jgi:hypothetical protein
MHGSSDDVWEDLIVSIFAVNNRSLEKAYALLPMLCRAGVVDLANLIHWDVAQVTARLKAAGFDQGTFMTDLFADDLVSLGATIRLKGIAACREVLLSGHSDAPTQFVVYCYL